jgi:hypothetical protein
MDVPPLAVARRAGLAAHGPFDLLVLDGGGQGKKEEPPHRNQRMIRRMKQRVTLSLDEATLAYLARKADQSTKGNVSAYVERLAQEAALTESVAQHAAWYKANPTLVEDAEAERLAAWDDEQHAA